jgi:ABC-type transport system involved in multi-copper enzyme maturation permease subunit
MTALTGRLNLRGRLPSLRGRRPSVRMSSGISAIIVKELRGRMRGRRAFVIITLHVLLLAVFAWMFERLSEEAINLSSSFGGTSTFASASVGRAVFLGLLFLQTLMISVLAPAATAGAISSEREHQTLELLAVTPISSLAIVLGKLFSALAWVFVLVLASIPITALVFVFGGVAPDDVIRGYIVLFATVIGLGSVGIFFSALTRRTGAATGLTFVVTLALIIGTAFVYVFLVGTAPTDSNGFRKQPSEAILYLNPFVAQADVACGTEDGFGGTCSLISSVLGTDPNTIINQQQCCPTVAPGVGIGGANVKGVAIPVPNPGGVCIAPDGSLCGSTNGDVTSGVTIESLHDRFWPRTVLSFLVLAAVMTLGAVQLVTPTRRWHPNVRGRIRGGMRRLFRRGSAA